MCLPSDKLTHAPLSSPNKLTGSPSWTWREWFLQPVTVLCCASRNRLPRKQCSRGQGWAKNKLWEWTMDIRTGASYCREDILKFSYLALEPLSLGEIPMARKTREALLLPQKQISPLWVPWPLDYKWITQVKMTRFSHQGLRIWRNYTKVKNIIRTTPSNVGSSKTRRSPPETR